MQSSRARYQTPSGPPRLVPSSAPAGGSSTWKESPEVRAAERGGTGRLARVVRWPFTSRLASPIWLAVRLYLGVFWLQMGLAKLQGGWLTTNPMDPMFRAIANGHTAAPFASYRGLVQVLLDLGMAPVVSMSFPIIEIAIGLSFISGVLVVPAAAGAILMNTNLILSGIATLAFDLRFIVLQLLLIVAWRVSSYIGLQGLLVKGFRAVRGTRAPARPARPSPCGAA